MPNTTFVNDTRAMSKGKVAIPKNIRAVLGIETGDRATFIVDGTSVRVVNSAISALTRFQERMKGESDNVGLMNEDDITK